MRASVQFDRQINLIAKGPAVLFRHPALACWVVGLALASLAFATGSGGGGGREGGGGAGAGGGAGGGGGTGGGELAVGVQSGGLER